MDGELVVHPSLPVIGQAVVGGGGVGEAGVAPDGREHDPPQDRAHRGHLPPGDVRVPGVGGHQALGGRGDLDDLLVAAVAEGSRGERVDLEFAELSAEGDVLLAGDVLVA